MKVKRFILCVAGVGLLLLAGTPQSGATLARFIQIVKVDDVDTRFHLAELEAFEVGVTPDNVGPEFDGIATSENDIGDGTLTTYGDGEFFPDIGTTDSLEHGGANKDPNNQLETGGAVWSTANGLAENAQYTLDLGAEFDVTLVRAWPRADGCCSTRWENLEINLYADDGGKPGTKNATATHTENEGNVALEFMFLPSVDTDEDGMPDAYETAHGLDPEVNDADGDLDGDGISNLNEFKNGTLPEETDSDEDGLDDPVETGTGTWVGPQDTGTSPTNSDTDGDGLLDGVETNTGSNPLDPTKYISPTNTGTDPHNKDTDGDGAADGLEVAGGTNPLDPNDEASNLVSGGRWNTIHCYSDGDQITDVLTAEDLINGDIEGECIEVKTDYIHFHDNVVPPYLNENEESRPYPLWDEENGGDGFGDREDFAIKSTGQINVKVAGTMTFVCNSDDGFDLRIDGESVGEAGNRGRGDTIMEVELTAGIHDIEFIHWERGGGAGVTVAVYRGLGNAPAPNSDDWELLQPIPETDTDGDGMPDSFETANGLDPNDPADGALDKDGDGVSNFEEFTRRIGVMDRDSDDDGIEDGIELGLTALTTAQEVPAPTLGDATPFGWATVSMNAETREVTIAGTYTGMTSAVSAAHLHGLADPGTAAGVLFALTASGGTAGTIEGSGILSEADFAGFLAGRTYINVHTANNGSGEIRGQVDPTRPVTNPKKKDTDGDGLLDGVETNTGTFVSATDTGTDPTKEDSDGDGFKDGREIDAGTDPTDPASFPMPQEGDLIAYWDFNDSSVEDKAVDNVSGIAGEVTAVYTEDGGGRSGAGGDRALNFADGGTVEVTELAFMDAVGITDSMTVSLWQKNEDIPDSSSFWITADGFDRAAQAHIPWSNNQIYWDTAGGCCAAGSQRLNFDPSAELDDFDFLDENWHHYVFLKNQELKQVWVDGVLAFETEGADPMPETDYTSLNIGSASAGGNPASALIDDFAIYAVALTEEQIVGLANGDTPGGGSGGPPFQITNLVIQEAGSVAVTWDSKAGRSYAVEHATVAPDSVTFDWIEAADGVESEGDATTFIDEDVPAGTKERYYRIREE